MTLVRCPGCRTLFRAQAEHLQSHGGMVRCGQCLMAFNALAHRVDSDPSPQQTPDTTEDSQETTESPSEEQTPQGITQTQPEDTGSTQHLGILPEPAALRSRRRYVTAETGNQPHGSEHRPFSPAGADRPSHRASSAAHVPENALRGDDLETRLMELQRRKQLDETVNEDAGPPLETEPKAAYEPPEQLPASPFRRALWALGLGLLLGVLVIQSLYLFRDPFTRQWPQARPWFEAACERLGCDMPLPRQAEHIVIESSGLEFVSEAPPLYVLHAQLQNQAPFAQALPHLELTLTGPDDEAVTRRSLSPEQWLDSKHETTPEDVFRGGSSITVQLPFATTETAEAQGYRLYVFYP